MNFYENFKNLCKNKGTTPTAVVKSLNLSTSKITAWKNGSIPKMETLKLLARFLNTSVDRFFVENLNETTSTLPPSDEGGVTASRDGGRDFSQDELQLIDAYRKLDLKGKSKILSYIFEVELMKQNKPNDPGYRIVAFGGDNEEDQPPIPEQTL